jgi:hypothetical protein
MLRIMFEQHPDLAVPPESYFPVSFHRHEGRYRPAGSAGFDLTRLAGDLLAHERFRAWQLDPAVVRARLSGVEPIGYAEAIRRVYALYAEARGTSRYGDKTPPFLLHMERLAGLFPEARFIHLVRDGRSAGLSLRDVGFGPRTVAGTAAYWAERVRLGRDAGRRLGPDRYLEVRYEDLVERTEATLRKLCAFIDLDFRPEMLAYRREVIERIPIGQRHRRGEGLSLRPPERGVRDWRTQMPPRDVAVFEAVAGRELQAFGYERTVPRPPVAARLRAAGHRAGAEVTRAARAMGRRLRGTRPRPPRPRPRSRPD